MGWRRTMTMLQPVTADEARLAAAALRGKCCRTPLVRLNWTPPDRPDLQIWLKLESLQPIGSFKIRGATTAVSKCDHAQLVSEGVVTASAGNMGQAVAYAAQTIGCRCTVVVPDQAPATKLLAMERRGARVIKVPYSRWWEIIESHQTSEAPGFFIHPVVDQRVMTGNGTIALEIVE